MLQLEPDSHADLNERGSKPRGFWLQIMLHQNSFAVASHHVGRLDRRSNHFLETFFGNSEEKTIMKRLLLARWAVGAVLAGLVLPQAQAVPFETITGTRTSGMFSWGYSYDIGFLDNILMIDVDIQLVGDEPVTGLRTRWESGIENSWSTDRFEVPIAFNVDWVTAGFDYSVTIVEGTGPWDMLTWYTDGASGWGDPYQELIAAHEYGHMIGLFDEYVGGAIDPASGLIGTGGLMHTLDGPTLDYYYDSFIGWYREKVVGIPAPMPLSLIGIGVLALLGGRVRSTRRIGASASS